MKHTLSSTIHCPSCHQVHDPSISFCTDCGQDMRAPLSGELGLDPMLGKVIEERYRILSVIGRGGMGMVYKVEHLLMGKVMAMKLLHPEYSRKPNAVKRFRQEIKAVSRLSHVHTISVFDCGVTKEQSLFIVMEYLHGADLEDLLAHNVVFTSRHVAKIASQICSSLAEAHAMGIIHRDVKPGNIILLHNQGQYNFVKVLDFGIAKLTDSDEESNSVTETGLIIGTPYYISPEQVTGEGEIGPASDIYCLGVVLFELLTGRRPFVGSSVHDFFEAHVSQPPPKPSVLCPERNIDPLLEDIVLRAMRKKSSERYASCEEMKEVLDYYLEQSSFADVSQRYPSYSGEDSSSFLDASSLVVHETRNRKGLANTSAQGTGSFQRETHDEVSSIGEEVTTVPHRLALQEEGWEEEKTELNNAFKDTLVSRGELVSLDDVSSVDFGEENLATKADWEQWEKLEKQWKRKRARKNGLMFLLLFSLIGLGLFPLFADRIPYFQNKEEKKTAVDRHELEPNNKASLANLLPIGKEITGELGTRLGPQQSDQDWYQVQTTSSQKVFKITLTPPPSVDLELGIYYFQERFEGTKKIRELREIASSNTGGPGVVEKIVYRTIQPSPFYILVREILVSGEKPQEFKGKYKLIVTHPLVVDFMEDEPNDTLSDAKKIEANHIYKGFHNRVKDLDFFTFQVKQKKMVHVYFQSVPSIEPTLVVVDSSGVGVSLWSVKSRKSCIFFKIQSDFPKSLCKRKKSILWKLSFRGEGTYRLRVSNATGSDVEEPYWVGWK